MTDQTIEMTEEMIALGAHVLSEWLNDNAPIGEAMYRVPAKEVFQEMLRIASTRRVYVEMPEQAVELIRLDPTNHHNAKFCPYCNPIADKANTP